MAWPAIGPPRANAATRACHLPDIRFSGAPCRTFDRGLTARVGGMSMRFVPLAASVAGAVLFGALIALHSAFVAPFAVCALLTAVGVWDLLQTPHSIRRNYPIAAHIRFM